jgi:hypothetical protein
VRREFIRTGQRLFELQFGTFLAWRLGEGEAMVRQVDKVLETTRSEVFHKVVSNSPRVASETLMSLLFDIDPPIEPERPVRIDLNLDQLEDADE